MLFLLLLIISLFVKNCLCRSARRRHSRRALPSQCQAGGKGDGEGWLGVRNGHGDGGDGEVGGVGSEGWRSKVRVKPAAPAAKVAPLPKPDPPPPHAAAA